jgi:hypothetical protein
MTDAPAWRASAAKRLQARPGSRISDVRFKQLRDTGAHTVVTACPFCAIMLKGAQASAGADTQFRGPDDVCQRQTLRSAFKNKCNHEGTKARRHEGKIIFLFFVSSSLRGCL